MTDAPACPFRAAALAAVEAALLGTEGDSAANLNNALDEGKEYPVLPFTRRLCLKHAAWAVDMTDFEEVPAGWQDLVSELFERIDAVIDHHPGERLSVLQIKEKLGGLRVYTRVITAPDRASEALSTSIHALVAEAERESFLTCDRCGRLGCLRSDAGFYATRCDEHARPSEVSLEGADGSPASPSAPSSIERVNRQGAALDRRDGWVRRGRAAPVEPVGRVGDPASARRIALYALDDVAAAAGQGLGGTNAGEGDDGYEGDPEEREPPSSKSHDTEHQARLQEILDAGERGRWRDLAGVPEGALEALDDLSRRAPHMEATTALVSRHLRAATSIGLPIAIPPLLLLGEPGVGKSWYLSRLAAALGLPFRVYPMNLSTLGEGLGGAHPSWRNSAPGLVAKTLMRERIANPLILVDEFDKAQSNGWSRDPYTAFYSLLDRSNSRAFCDEYLQFPIDASGIAWVLAGNDASMIPEPIMDRLTVITIPAMDPSQIAMVCRSIYAEANAARLGYFDTAPADVVVDRLQDLTPRSVRIAIEDAMVTAAADGRRILHPDDVRPRARQAARRIGFRS